jgi:hypothetical protein
MVVVVNALPKIMPRLIVMAWRVASIVPTLTTPLKVHPIIRPYVIKNMDARNLFPNAVDVEAGAVVVAIVVDVVASRMRLTQPTDLQGRLRRRPTMVTRQIR